MPRENAGKNACIFRVVNGSMYRVFVRFLFSLVSVRDGRQFEGNQVCTKRFECVAGR